MHQVLPKWVARHGIDSHSGHLMAQPSDRMDEQDAHIRSMHHEDDGANEASEEEQDEFAGARFRPTAAMSVEGHAQVGGLVGQGGCLRYRQGKDSHSGGPRRWS